MTSINNPKIYNFPILNKPPIISSNNPVLGINNGSNETSNSLNFNSFIEDYESFEERSLENALININIQRREYQPTNYKIAQRQISQMYILPELYILYSKIYSSFFLRQNYTFDFLSTYDDFYRMTQYDYAHDNPNIISINELLKMNADKKTDNNMTQLIKDFGDIVESIKSYGNDTNNIMQNINDFMVVMKRILDKKYNNEKTLETKIKQLMTKLKDIFRNTTEFEKYFETSKNNPLVEKIRNINLNSNKNEQKELTFSSLNSLIMSMNNDLENLNNFTTFNSGTKRGQSEYRSLLNTIMKLFEEIQFLYFQTYYKNLSSNQDSLLNIKSNDSESNKINEFIQEIQQISILLRSENSSVDSLLKSISEYIDILLKKDEDLKSQLDTKKKNIDVQIKNRKELIEKINAIKESFKNLNRINKNKNTAFNFINKWFDLLLSIKCKELKCIFVLIGDKNDFEPCKSINEIDKTKRDEFKNNVSTSFSNIRTYFKSISDVIKNKTKEFESDLIEIKQLLDLTKIPETNKRELEQLNQEIQNLNGKIRNIDREITRSSLSSNNRRLSTSEQDRIVSERRDERKRDYEAQLNPKLDRQRELEIQQTLAGQKIIILRDKETFLTQSINTLKQLNQSITTDANDFVVDKMKVLIENIFNIFTIYARVYKLSDNLIKKKDKLTTSEDPSLKFFKIDTLYTTMQKLLDIEPIMNRRANRPEMENRTKSGLKRYRLRVKRTMDNFKKVLVPRLIEYYKEKERYFNEQDSILAAFSLDIASLVPKMNESSVKNLNADSLSLGPLVNRFNFSNQPQTTSSSSSSPSSYSNKSQIQTASPIQQSRYGMAYGGANINASKTPQQKVNIKNPVIIYSEYCGKILQGLINKISSNINYLNRVNTFKIMFNKFDKIISDKILRHLLIIFNSKNLEYNFPFAEQVRFIVLRYSNINQELKNIQNNYNKNSSFNFMQNYYLTDFFYMYLVLQLTFYNFIMCIKPKFNPNTSHLS